jgi:ABC-type sugar transport system ATPase subunit
VIAGENGAGKSTLIRVLSGVHDDYTGEVELDGRPVRLRMPAQARALGIHTIHQELSLVPSLSVVDNVYLTQRGPAFGRFSRKKARPAAESLLRLVGLELDPDLPVERLSLSERQLLEIGRAISERARILILDEPTSALSEAEAERLFTTLGRFRAAGTSAIYISHRMEEIYRVASRISVLRDGELLLTETARDLPEALLVRAMLGERLQAERQRATPRVSRADAPLRLSVRGLGCSARPPLEEIDFELREGEVLGLAGVRGSGASQVLRALFGAFGPVRGQIELSGASYRPSSPRAALERGLSLLTSDRRESVIPDLSVLSNATLSSLEAYTRFGLVDARAEALAVSGRIAALRLRTASLSAAAGTLSGGNQQKLALLRCLLSGPKLLLLEDPLRGVDVGAKADLIELISELAESGLSILFHSSEIEDFLRVCERVLVLCSGRMTQVVTGRDLTRERLLGAVMGNCA